MTAVTETSDQIKLHELLQLLERASRELGEAGRPESASTIAAEAWAAVREQLPADAGRLSGLLDRLNSGKNRPIRTPRAECPTGPALDVRADPPAHRHRLIFEAFQALGPGEGFVLVNDHDPKPLYYQFVAEYPDSFEWKPIEEGPEVWRVYIGSLRAGTEPVAIAMVELQSIATMVIEGLRVRGFESVLVADADACAAWNRLQETLHSGHIRHAESADLGRLLEAICRATDDSGGGA